MHRIRLHPFYIKQILLHIIAVIRVSPNDPKLIFDSSISRSEVLPQHRTAVIHLQYAKAIVVSESMRAPFWQRFPIHTVGIRKSFGRLRGKRRGRRKNNQSSSVQGEEKGRKKKERGRNTERKKVGRSFFFFLSSVPSLLSPSSSFPSLHSSFRMQMFSFSFSLFPS